jgi:hypothetical protein
VSTSENSLRTRIKLVAVLLSVAGIGAVVLGCYALFIKAQAESLLKDVATLRVGKSTESEVEQVERKHRRYVVSHESTDEVAITTFKVQNSWLAALKLEPLAWFGTSVSVKSGHVCCISAWLMRSMNIYPTFTASAGMVEEYAEYPEYFSRLGLHHLDFPTPVGKPYLRVVMDSHVSTSQRRRAFSFSFRCLIKPGGGCDLPCDYLPLAWQDWKASLQGRGFSDDFDRRYPKSLRCKQ